MPMICECPNCAAFQPKAEKCCCGESDSVHRTDGPCYKIQKPDPVESAITEVVNMCGIYNSSGLEMKLRNLLALARGSK